MNKGERKTEKNNNDKDVVGKTATKLPENRKAESNLYAKVITFKVIGNHQKIK